MVVVTITQSGNDVLLEGSGTLNTSSLVPVNHNWASLENISGFGYPQVVFNAGRMFWRERWHGNISGPDIGDFIHLYHSDTYENTYHRPDVFSGDYFGIAEHVSNNVGNKILIPHNYVSGAFLQASYTFYNKTLIDFGLTGTESDLTWTWGEGASQDSFVLKVTPVPEPSSYALLLGGLALGLIALRRRL